MELTSLEDDAAINVYADQLEERGDPRGLLIRQHLAEVPSAQLISQHWAQWVGSVPPQEVLLRWERGHVVEAALRAPPASWQLRELLERPALRFVRRLAVGPRAEVEPQWFQLARSLQHLVWFTAPRSVRSSPERLVLPELQRLTLFVQGADPAGLATAVLPRLQHLDTGCTPAAEPALLEALAVAGFWPTVSTWTHRLQTVEGLAAVLACKPLLARGGRGVRLLCEAPVWRQLTPAHRQALPEAEFIARPVPAAPVDPEDPVRAPDVGVTPLYAALDFRDLPPWQTREERSSMSENGTDTVSFGSGVPHEHLRLGPAAFTACGWCGSADTWCLYESNWASYSHFETTSYTRWEHECRRCGLFTSCSSARSR